MIPDTRQRLEKALHDLQSTLVSSCATRRSSTRRVNVPADGVLRAT